jgi:hypothetical protein
MEGRPKATRPTVLSPLGLPAAVAHVFGQTRPARRLARTRQQIRRPAAGLYGALRATRYLDLLERFTSKEWIWPRARLLPPKVRQMRRALHAPARAHAALGAPGGSEPRGVADDANRLCIWMWRFDHYARRSAPGAFHHHHKWRGGLKSRVSLFPKDVCQLLWRTYLNKCDRLVVWWAHGSTVTPSSSLEDYCAEHGYVELLQYFPVPRTSEMRMSLIAATRGHLNVLQWLLAKNNDSSANFAGSCVYLAAKSGAQDVVAWLRPHFPSTWAYDRWVGAAAGGHLDVLQSYQRRPASMIGDADLHEALKGGHLHTAKFLCDYPIDSFVTMAHAASSGSIPLVEWLRTRSAPWDAQACARAARNGHLPMVQRLRANGCPWDSFTCYGATEGNHLELLQWARAHGCPWWIRSHVPFPPNEALQWARANGAP